MISNVGAQIFMQGEIAQLSPRRANVVPHKKTSVPDLGDKENLVNDAHQAQNIKKSAKQGGFLLFAATTYVEIALPVAVIPYLPQDKQGLRCNPCTMVLRTAMLLARRACKKQETTAACQLELHLVLHRRFRKRCANLYWTMCQKCGVTAGRRGNTALTWR